MLEGMRQDQRLPRVVLTLSSFGLGGAARVALHLANGMAQRADVHVVVTMRGGAGEQALKSIDEHSATVHYLLDRKPVSRMLAKIVSLPALVRKLRALHPDLVIADGNNSALATAFAFLLAFGHRKGLYIKVTNPVVRPHDGRLAIAIRKFGYSHVFSLASGVLALSDAECRVLRAQFPELADRFSTVANPYVAPGMLARADAAGTARTGPPLAIAVGRLHLQKRFDRLLRAWARVSCPGAKLCIVGEGPDRAALGALVSELGLADRVAMPGYSADVSSWLARADVFVLSSDYEGLPAVVLEAMAFNCPIVSTDCFAAARELVGNAEQCHVVPRGDIGMLAARIDEVLAGRSRPTTLRQIAERYSLAAGVESHCVAVGLANCVPDRRA
jgi:glycosyltransferase involved in cell wall biosynthesis